MELPSQAAAASAASLALENGGDCMDLALVEGAAKGKRKREDSGSDSGDSNANEPCFPEDASSETEIFFKVSHRQLNRHKLFEKGALSTYDMAIQLIPTKSCSGTGSNMQAVLDVSMATAPDNQVKLATWLNEANVSFQDLQQHWKVWESRRDESVKGNLSNFWDMDAVNWSKYLPQVPVARLGIYRQLVSAVLTARAVPTGHTFAPDPADRQHMIDLQHAGVVVEDDDGIGFRPGPATELFKWKNEKS